MRGWERAARLRPPAPPSPSRVPAPGPARAARPPTRRPRQLLRADQRVQGGPGGRPGLLPTPVHRLGIGLEESVGLDPGPARAGRHRQVLQLGPGQPGLDLQVGRVGPGEPLLPVPAAGAGAPVEQLAAAQPVGGRLDQAGPGLVQRGDPPAFAVRDVQEVVRRAGQSAGIAAVGALVVGEGDLSQIGGVVEVEGAVGGAHHPGPLRLGHGDVGPPVDRDLGFGGVVDGDVDVQDRGAGRQPGVDLQHQLPQAFELVHPQHGRAVRGGDPYGVQRLAGQRPVPGGAEVPLHAAGHPGVPQGEVGRLQDRVAVQQFAARGTVHQRPEPPP